MTAIPLHKQLAQGKKLKQAEKSLSKTPAKKPFPAPSKGKGDD